jgi:ribosome maturation factor RimP
MTPERPHRDSEPARQRLNPAAEENILAQVTPLAESLCDAEGLELVHVEFRREQSGRILRLYIDKPGGVGLEDCAAVSRELGDILDVHLPEVGPYHLEVSSPGVNRPLSRPADFERFAGRSVRIRTTGPINGQRNFSGVLGEVSAGAVTLIAAGGRLTIPLDRIAKANLMGA